MHFPRFCQKTSLTIIDYSFIMLSTVCIHIDIFYKRTIEKTKNGKVEDQLTTTRLETFNLSAHTSSA